MAPLDLAITAHLEWLGFLRPTGLVVSAPALVRAGAILDSRDIEGQRRLAACVEERTLDKSEELEPSASDYESFASSVLGWSFSPKGYAGSDQSPIPPELEVHLPDYDETLRPDFAVCELEPPDGAVPWQLLVKVLKAGEGFDQVVRGNGQLEASAHGRMERLLRESGVSAGVLFNGRALRLISAPRGESSGWLDFKVAEMLQTAGRPICTAMRLLLSEQRLLALPRHQRLAALLADSRKFQNEVSERLSEQVLQALYELLRGFQAAHDASGGKLLGGPLAERPDDVYRAMLTVILRLVFLLYAEERDMLPADETFIRSYSVADLFDRLRSAAALYPDTMDQRYGAWPQLLVLFRMIHDGAVCGEMHLPPRHGVLFDPDRYAFLEGRGAGARQIHERIDSPLVSDGTIWRVLEKLLVLDGERISYRALDVEQIGSVYETMMGFRLEIATGQSVAIRSSKKSGAATTVDIEEALVQSAAKRAKWVGDRADRKIPPGVAKAVSEATTIEGLHAALLPVIDGAATPDLVPNGAMVLQPSEERRRSGSHYTPRALTEPIVRKTLEPILSHLRGADELPPRPGQILELKVCDPAMGSGAFLVEVCRQLADELVEAWHAHGELPATPADEDEVVYARRLIAQRCIYGVDRNPVAVDLAKMSLWLVTLARDHSLTFMDHALRHGDSLVGLTLRQIEAFDWKEITTRFDEGYEKGLDEGFEALRVRAHTDMVAELRKRIRGADESVSDEEIRDLWDEALNEIDSVRLFGDLVLAAYFEGSKPKEREGNRLHYARAVLQGRVAEYRSWLTEWRHADPPLAPFHWEIEFPEVFERETPGFDAIVGNPPFGGKNTLAAANVAGYLDWLKHLHELSHGNSDVVAHFFRRVFSLIREGGTFGLVATNTIAQGDTRATGLRWICSNGGQIYAATKRYKWPGMAAVVVSIVHVVKGGYEGQKLLDDRAVENITAFLFHQGGHDDPARLTANAGKSFVGSYLLGMGFTFDDTDTKGVATPIAERECLIAKDPRNQEVIFPYIGGEEVNTSPTHAYHRYAIDFFDRSEAECRERWPDLMAIVEAKVKPERDRQKRKALRERWWQYAEKRPGLCAAIAGLDRVLVISRVGQHAPFTRLPVNTVFSEQLIVFPFSAYAAICALQARPHEVWARFFSSSLGDGLRYTPTDCFETFPFPENWETNTTLEAAGKAYYDYRADLMIRNDEGLTKTYNRFHDPDEASPEIAKLRELHDAMDRAVLDAYGWSDIPTECEFLLDYEIDEEEEGSRRKKPWRYRWPDDVRDEVLARLLALNAERAAAEGRASSSSAQTNTKATRSNAGGKKEEGALF